MSNTMAPHESLAPNEARDSANGQARFVFQDDGNLVLYIMTRDGWVARWASNTAGRPAVTCAMQGDGNLVIYDAAGAPTWDSKTWGHPGASLVVQDDGNVVIYENGNALWSSNTWTAQGWTSPRSEFDLASSGFRFENYFQDAKILGFPATGLCGGMTFAALDYHHAGYPASDILRIPPTDSGVLGPYIMTRQIQSLTNKGADVGGIILAILGVPIDLVAGIMAAAVPNYNLQQFIGAQVAADGDLRARSMRDEWPKLRQAIDAGQPVPIGLFARDGLTNAHQVVAVGYRDGVHDRFIRIYDPNEPTRFCELWVAGDRDIVEDIADVHGWKRWRGFFVEEYRPSTPPLIGIPEATATDAKVLDAGLYLRIYGDLQAAFGADTHAATRHWLTYGTREGRRANTVFDAPFYLRHHADLSAAFGDDNERAIEHWINNGLQEGRRSSLEFDVAWYLNNHNDLVNAFGPGNHAAAVQHWMNHGLSEGRRSSADFDVGYYLGAHPDLINAFGANNYTAALEHWLMAGKMEGRKPVA
jgi:hypothetical protein